MTPQERISAAGSVDRAQLILTHDLLEAINRNTDQAQTQNALLSAQLDGLREQLIAIRTDLREESIFHKLCTGIRRLFA